MKDYYYKSATVEVLLEMNAIFGGKRYLRLSVWNFFEDDEYGAAEACNFFENSNEPQITGNFSGGPYIISLRASRTGNEEDSEEIAVWHSVTDHMKKNFELYKKLEDSGIQRPQEVDSCYAYKAWIEDGLND